MKKIVACSLCDKPVRKNNTYKADLEIITYSPITGKREIENLVGQICGSCAYEAGYKVRKELRPE